MKIIVGTKMGKLLLVFATFALLLICIVSADTPANCSYSDAMGTWILSESAKGNDKNLDCSQPHKAVQRKLFTLTEPATARDQFGNIGFWTLVYNQGFEVVIGGRKYFVYFAYSSTTSICNQTEIGWSHNINGGDWACVRGQKKSGVAHHRKPILYKSNLERFHRNRHVNKDVLYKPNPDFVKFINAVQNAWQAVNYQEYEGKTLRDMFSMAGGPKSKIAGIPFPNHELTEEHKSLLKDVPDSLDWRNISGVNYVSPVRNQGTCGSCYAFSSVGMMEARLRVYTNNTVKSILSPQDIVECSEYSQGCGGGFPYLIGGKYAADFGMVPEKCNPYTGIDGACSTQKDCLRQYGFQYSYVGGYYGGCNENLMKLALMRGPLSVSFEVYNDFMAYKGGVYHHVEGLEDKLNPFEITNHAVLLVGYGTDATAGAFWIVKNSWGTGWGENGYFRIRRGVDECSIESIAVESLPVL